MIKKTWFFVFVLFLAVSFSVLSFANKNPFAQQPADNQEKQPAELETPNVSENSEAAAVSKPVSTEWIYGEVNSVDIAGKFLTLTYLDYDTDIEKQSTVYCAENTVFENVKSLEEIKPQDMVSVDYVVGADGRNSAVSISVEKPESAEDIDIGLPSSAAGSGVDIKPAVEPPVSPAQESPAGAVPETEAGKAK